MANPFAGLIDDALLTAFDNAIDAVIEGCEAPCKFVYPSTRYETCDECIGSDDRVISPNPHLPGPKNKNNYNTCSSCGGTRQKPVENSEIISMPVIWDSKSFFHVASQVKYAEGYIQTICSIEFIDKIKKCQNIIPNTGIQDVVNNQYTRDGEPEPLGFRVNSSTNKGYVLTMWKKS